jgi:hypothetical protein
LLAVAARVAGVARVNGVLLAKGSNPDAPTVPINHMQLPRLLAVGVRVGSPQSLSELRGEQAREDLPEVPSVPIPIIPPEC